MSRAVRLHMAPWMVAGVQTQFFHLHSELARAGVELTVSEVHPWLSGGRLEQLPLPARTKGTIRSISCLRRLSRQPADALWAQVALPLLPYLFTTSWLRSAPVFYAIDCTPRLLSDLDAHYRANASDPASVKGRLTTLAYKAFFRRCCALLPWSSWAARSMIDDYGADPERVRVLPPGIDTERWRPAASRPDAHGKLQVLFVGGDFERKGGPLLLELHRKHLRQSCDLHLVTRERLEPEPGVYPHHGLRPNDAALLELFQRSDVLVVPTLADCFSMAAIEAMACGLPVITSLVGGIPEIVVEGQTGFLVPPGDATGLLAAIQAVVADPGLRRRLGHAGRDVAVDRFNGAAQAMRLLDLILSSLEPRTFSSRRPDCSAAEISF